MKKQFSLSTAKKEKTLKTQSRHCVCFIVVAIRLPHVLRQAIVVVAVVSSICCNAGHA